MTDRNVIINADVMEGLRQLPDGCVQTVITSPPYWGLRDYGTADWQGGDEKCDHTKKTSEKIDSSTLVGSTNTQNHAKEGFKGNICLKCGAIRIDKQLGLEKTPEEYVAKMVAIFRELWRVLRDDGTVWLNLGDSYARQSGSEKQQSFGDSGKLDKYKSGSNKPPPGLKEKDLCGIPWRVALALQADGWYLRSDIIWSKPNPMPESVTDRPTKSHEYLFLLTKKAQYYYDAEAIREQTVTYDDSIRDRDNTKLNNTPGRTKMGGLITNQYTGRNRRSVWTIPTEPFDGEYCTNCRGYFTGKSKLLIKIIKVIKNGKEVTKRICPTCQSTEHWVAHFATFPQKLVEPCIMAGTSERGACHECGQCWERVVEMSDKYKKRRLTGDKPQMKNLGVFIKKARIERDMSTIQVAESGNFYGNINHGGSVANWENGESVPTPEQWRILKNILKLDASFDNQLKVWWNENGKNMWGKSPEILVAPSAAPAMNKEVKTIGWRPACDCNAGEPVPCHVLDIFAGVCTVAYVALRANRDYTMIELNPDYIDMSNKRLAPLRGQRRMI